MSFGSTTAWWQWSSWFSGRASLSTTKTMTEDKLEGTGLPAHGLVFLDVSWVLALPLYLYVEP